MKDVIIGFCLLFSVPTCFHYWYTIIYLEKTKQINLKEENKK